MTSTTDLTAIIRRWDRAADRWHEYGDSSALRDQHQAESDLLRYASELPDTFIAAIRSGVISPRLAQQLGWGHEVPPREEPEWVQREGSHYNLALKGED